MKPSALLNLPTLDGLIPDPMKIGIDEEPIIRVEQIHESGHIRGNRNAAPSDDIK